MVDTLFTHDPAKEQLHYVADPNMVGETYGGVRRRVNGAVVLGYQTGPSTKRITRLNPADEDVFQVNDELLVLAKHGKCTFNMTPVVDGALSSKLGCLRLVRACENTGCVGCPVRRTSAACWARTSASRARVRGRQKAQPARNACEICCKAQLYARRRDSGGSASVDELEAPRAPKQAATQDHRTELGRGAGVASRGVC